VYFEGYRIVLPAESEWIGRKLAELPVDEISPCLNLGSSTEEFRSRVQPYIDANLIAPNIKRGVSFIHVDVKKELGVDLAGDINDPAFQEILLKKRAACVLCCNMLEHVVDREKLAELCVRITRPGGYLIVSVPFSFPYHLDPIDTYFRPDPKTLAELFPKCQVISTEIVTCETYWQELSKMGHPKRLFWLARLGVRILLPFYKPEHWKERLHSLLWLFKPYSVSVAVLRVNAAVS
jgi:SAM-dependent methyltransferase